MFINTVTKSISKTLIQESRMCHYALENREKDRNNERVLGYKNDDYLLISDYIEI